MDTVTNGSNNIDTIRLESNFDAMHEIELNIKLDKFWLQKAELELGETAENRSIKLTQLKELILLDNDIPNARTDDAFLLRFLRAKKFDVDKSFRMIQKYFKMKKESPELFRVSPSSDMHDILKMQIQQTLSNRDEYGSIIYVFRVQNCDPYKCHVEQIFRCNVLALEHAIRDPCTQIGGLVVLLDMSGLNFTHAKFMSPHLAKRTVEVIQEAFPMRFKAFHILHEPFYFDAILAILRPFLKEKIKNRIFTHGNDLSSLHRHIPNDILPIEYGGKQTSFDNTKWREEIIRDENYFLRLESYNYDRRNTKLSISSESISEKCKNSSVESIQAFEKLKKMTDDDETMIGN